MEGAAREVGPEKDHHPSVETELLLVMLEEGSARQDRAQVTHAQTVTVEV